MVDPWELILQHSYSGTPGVVYDESPKHASPGWVNGLASSDFIVDGASPGSGAVRFPSTGLSAHGDIQVVPAGDVWSPLEGLACEIVCAFDRPGGILHLGGGLLIDAGVFKFTLAAVNIPDTPAYLAIPHATYAPFPHDPSATISVPMIVNDSPIAWNQWGVLGFYYDGISTAEIRYNGELICQALTPLAPLPAPSQIVIGPTFGLIDDVKVWRLNPMRMVNDFLNRPMDSATRYCVMNWLNEIQALLDANPECAQSVLGEIGRGLRSGLQQLRLGDDDTRQRFQAAVATYDQAWTAGDFDTVAATVADLIDWLTGPDSPMFYPGIVKELLGDPCARQLSAALPPLTCDPELNSLMQTLAGYAPTSKDLS
jgi:hypothetical protein